MKRLFCIAILGILVFPPYALGQRSQSAKKYVNKESRVSATATSPALSLITTVR